MKLKPKTDLNQASIVRTFEQCGATVANTASMGGGFPDLVVGFCGHNYLVECKAKRGKLTPRQIEFMLKWKGQYAIIRSPLDAVEFLNEKKIK